MTVLAFPTRPNTPARPDSRRLFAALLIAAPEAIEWALAQMMPELLAEEPLPGETSDADWDARLDVAWDVIGDLLHEWIDANGLTIPTDDALVLDGAA